MSKKREIIYKKEFEENFDEIYGFINESSEQSANKFASEVKNKLEWIIKNPTAGTVETQIHSKYHWYRFKTVMKSWKIVYKLTKSMLVFLGIIHVKRNPNEIKKLGTNTFE